MPFPAVYSDANILKEREAGNIIIEPFVESQLNNCSYNVTVSEFFFREKLPHRWNTPKTFLNPWSEDHIKRRWEQGEVMIGTDQDKEKGIQAGDKYILLQPQETILVATNEFIGGRGHITAEMRGRSSGGRALLSVCGGAGWGDVGYVNRWTLMVTNLSRYAMVVLPVGYSIAQIIFLECGQPLKSYQGKYQDQIDHSQDPTALIEHLKKKWSPSMMLPQLFKEVQHASPEAVLIGPPAPDEFIDEDSCDEN